MAIDAQDTASWMAGCRAAMPDLSQDPYAEHWLTEGARAKHAQYVDEVSPTENVALSLRGRFFLEEVSTFLRENPDSVFINIGAGFCSYPFLMPEGGAYFEVDCEDNVRHKQERIRELVGEGILPPRDIQFEAVDLENLAQMNSLPEILRDFAGDKKTFILYEGLVYYLTPETVQRLMDLARDLQVPGSRLGLNSWTPDALTYPTYLRFRDFFRRHNRGKLFPTFSCHRPEIFSLMPGYRLVEQTGYVELSERFEMQPPLTPQDDVFWETISVLERE